VINRNEVVPVPGSAASRRRLGAEFRRLREAAGKTLDDAAARLECSATKVSRIESGQVSVRPLDGREMLDLYGVTGARQEALLTLVREARKDGWWHAYGDVIPDGYEFFVGLEDEAATICDYQPFLIPGLLQTEDYMRALMSVSGIGPDRADRRIALRLQRQSILTGENPPHLHVVIEEAVLHRPVGGAETLRAQLAHLVAAAARPNITLQVVLTKVGMHPAEGHPFILLGFPNPLEPKVVCTEHINEAILIDDVDKLGRFLVAFDSLRGVALPPAKSVELISSLLDEQGDPNDAGELDDGC
jgi:transcriptional regulator with XRE-family HTH domain